MEQYKISQNPGTNKGSKKASKPSLAVPKRRDTRRLDPQVIMLVVLAVLALVFGGVAWAHFFNKKPASVGGGGKSTSQTKPQTGATGVIPGQTFTAVTTAIGNKNPAGLRTYYAKKVHVVMPKSTINQTLDAAQVESIISNPLNSAQTPWNWHVPPGDLAAWQQGPYGQYFIGDVLVGISADGTVISIHFDQNGQIDTVFIAPVTDLTTPAAPSGNTPSGANQDTPAPTPTTPTPVTSNGSD